jgi:hypothetical protein
MYNNNYEKLNKPETRQFYREESKKCREKSYEMEVLYL